MPFVRISWFSGRTVEQKRNVAKAITEALLKHGGVSSPDRILILFDDHPKESFAFGNALVSEEG